MANRLWTALRGALEKEVCLIMGRISINASAAVTASLGRGWSVAKGAAGLYNVTLQDKYPQLLSASFGVIASGTLLVHPEIKSESILSAGTLVIKTVSNVGAETDTGVAFDLLFTLFLRNSTVV